MNDLNTMMRDQARAGLQAQLDTAVTGGDVEAARKITDQIAKLDVQTAPKAPPYGDAEIRTHLDKLPWFGTDPKKSQKAVELGKNLDPKKFPTAEAFAAAIAKAVDDEFKPATAPKKDEEEDGDDEEGEEDGDGEEDEEGKDKKPEKKPRRTDGPGAGDATGGRARRASGPWTKLSDAPRDVQAEIKRSADKFVTPNAPKERREEFVKRALESHYAQHQRAVGNKGKK